MGKRKADEDKVKDDGTEEEEEEEVDDEDDSEDGGKKSKKEGKKDSKQKSKGKDKDTDKAAKKQRTEEEGEGEGEGDGEMKKNEDGDMYIELGPRRRLTIRTFKKNLLVDLREYYEDKASGQEKPGKKGISLSKENWEALKQHIGAIDSEVERKLAE